MRIIFAVLTISALAAAASAAAPKPNVLIVMPDDLSYNDYSAWNPSGPRTPHVDALGKESVSLTDFHVAPTCSPSRAQLMTGRYNNATGAWHTSKGRELLRADEITMAQVFSANGYRTGIAGKWHLGSAYPLRAEDRGYDYTAVIHGGGTDQQPDFWGNTNALPSTYFVNDRPVALTDEPDGIPGAFSTNFFTNRAIEFMRDCADHQVPFFLYVAYNVAHLPYDMPPDARPGIDAHTATVENLDKNVGRLIDFLQQVQLADNTILIFILGDNGMSNELLRGDKATEYEAGHRVPCYVRWKNGGLAGDKASAREMPRLTSEIDLLPTLMNLAGLRDTAHRPAELPMHGRNLAELLKGDATPAGQSMWNRVITVDNQRGEQLVKHKQACVMRDETDAVGHIMHKWRLMKPAPQRPWELYDILRDPKRQKDLAGETVAPCHSILR